MVHRVAAAGIQLRGAAPGGGTRRLLARNSATGFVCAFFATFMGFALIWHIWWLVAVSFVGAFATFVVFAWRDRTEELIPAAEVARIDRANRRARRVRPA